jgi:acetylornithine/succinyldiaminopimelate/putrescine aminotransferase
MNGLKEDLVGSRVAREVRGKGLMIAVDIRVKVQEILWKAIELGLIALYSGKTTLRLLPPLIINDEEITKGNAMLTESLKWYEKTHT